VPILTNKTTEHVSAQDITLDKNVLSISLSDGRIISLPIDKISWLAWLAQASLEAQKNWSLEPGGFAIYWDDLDNGIEIEHFLSLSPLV